MRKKFITATGISYKVKSDVSISRTHILGETRNIYIKSGGETLLEDRNIWEDNFKMDFQRQIWIGLNWLRVTSNVGLGVSSFVTLGFNSTVLVSLVYVCRGSNEQTFSTTASLHPAYVGCNLL
jgi:hypothetical protein